MADQNRLQYYRTKSNELQPFLKELEQIKIWAIAETILQNVILAVEELGDTQNAPEQLQSDSLVNTRRRQHDAATNLSVYETYFWFTTGQVPCVAFSWDGKTAIALWPGYRSKLEAINRLSGFPYLRDATSRLAEEKNTDQSSFTWQENQVE